MRVSSLTVSVLLLAALAVAQGVNTAPGIGGGSGGSSIVLPVVQPETSGARGDGAFYFDGSISAPALVQSSGIGASATPTAPSITTAAANSLVVWAFLGNDAWTTAPPTGTNRILQTFQASHYALTINDEIAASAGATPTVSGTLASSKNWVAGSIAMQPQGGSSIAYVAQSNVTTSTGNSLAVTTPAGAADGDTLIACVDWYASGNSITWPSGWALLFQTKDGIQDEEDCGYLRLNGAVPANFTWTTIGGFGGAVGVLAYSGVGTISTLTSPTAGFTSADVGKPICTAGTGAAGAQQCGTIAQYNSATSVGVGYVALTTGSGLWFSYGTNDDAAFSAMLTSAPCSTVGCRVQLQPHGYVLTAPLTLPPNRTIQFLGAGEGLANTENSYLNGNTAPNVNTGTRLMFTTNSMPSAAITIGGTVHQTSTTAFDMLSDLAVIGGAGKGRDGGGKDGVDILNWQGAELNRVGVVNFAGIGVYVDGMTASDYQDYIEDILMKGVYVLWNGAAGIQDGSNLGVFNIETVTFDDGVSENNGGPGIYLAGHNVQGFHAANNVIQWNNTVTANPEIKIDNAPSGCVLIGNYIESDSTAGSKSSVWATQGASCTAIANHVQQGGAMEPDVAGINVIPTGYTPALQFAAMANGCSGTATLAAGTVTVSNACIIGTRPVTVTELNAGTPNAVGVSAQAAGSLTIKSASGTDTSTVYWSQQ